MSDWKERLTTLGFRPTGMGGMRGRFEDIDIVAVEHPFNGLCIMGNQFDGKQGCDFETFIPVDSDFQAIAAALVHIHDLVHPKQAPIPPPDSRAASVVVAEVMTKAHRGNHLTLPEPVVTLKDEVMDRLDQFVHELNTEFPMLSAYDFTLNAVVPSGEQTEVRRQR